MGASCSSSTACGSSPTRCFAAVSRTCDGPCRFHPRRFPIDAVLITHQHLDHLDLPSLELIGRELPLVVPQVAGPLLRRRHFHNVTEVVEGDVITFGGVRVIAVPALHDGRRLLFGESACGPRLRGRGLCDASTSQVTPVSSAGMAELRPLDAAALPVWGWGPTLGPGHLSPEEAAEAVVLLDPRIAVPIHYGTYGPIGSTSAIAGAGADVRPVGGRGPDALPGRDPRGRRRHRSRRCGGRLMADWLDKLWDNLTAVSVPLLILGIACQTAQTCLVALAWRNILRGAYPDDRIGYRKTLSYYAGGNGLNALLPASAGTVAMLGLYRAAINGSTVAGLLGATFVENIFFAIVGALIYLWLFLGVAGSFDVHFGGISDHWVALDDHHRRRRGPDLPGRADALAPAEAHLGERQGGRRDPVPSAPLRGAGGGGRVALVRRADGRQRHVHVRLPHPGVDHERVPDRGRRVGLLDRGHRAGRGRRPDGARLGRAEGRRPAERDPAYTVGQQVITTAWNVAFGLTLLATEIGWKETRRMIHFRKKKEGGDKAAPLPSRQRGSGPRRRGSVRPVRDWSRRALTP